MLWLVVALVIYGNLTTGFAIYYGIKKNSFLAGICMWLLFPKRSTTAGGGKSGSCFI